MSSSSISSKVINLHTIPKDELEQIVVQWGHAKYRAQQIMTWVREQGVQEISEMTNLPKMLRQQLEQHATLQALQLDGELVSKDGTRKRIYRLWDGQIIESVLMPYEDGRYTACISSQAGCAQGCVFCATGQMGFSRQLTPEEIFEQVSRFAAELRHDESKEDEEEDEEEEAASMAKNQKRPTKKKKGKRLSNIVFMDGVNKIDDSISSSVFSW